MAQALHAEPTADDRPLPAHTPIAIIGAGFAGMGMGIRLLQSGVEDFVIMERDSDVGGTWWANTYPGCQCDVPSHLYSFSFALNPDWGRTYATQPEIEAYILRVTEQYGLRPHVETDCAVTSATWDEANVSDTAPTEKGDYTADVVVCAPGPL